MLSEKNFKQEMNMGQMKYETPDNIAPEKNLAQEMNMALVKYETPDNIDPEKKQQISRGEFCMLYCTYVFMLLILFLGSF